MVNVFIEVRKIRRIICTGCGPASINVQQSLRLVSEPFYIVGTDINKYHLYFSLADKNYVVPRATDKGYIDALNDIIIKEKIEFIHPQPDTEVLVIGAYREELNAKTFLPSDKTIFNCQDKFLTYCILKAARVPVPKTQAMNDTYYPFNLFEAGLDYPFWVRVTKGAGGKASNLVTSKEMMKCWVQYWMHRGVKIDDFTVQEYLPGRNIGWHSLWKDGELVTSMARERVEYIYPYLAPSGITGTPSVQRTINDKEVNKVGTRAVLAIDSKYNGLAMVDLKENDKGVPCVTEINPGRMFTTSFFYSKLGALLGIEANFPHLLVKLAFGEKINIPNYNILPEGYYWIRHIDCGTQIVKDNEVLWRSGI